MTGKVQYTENLQFKIYYGYYFTNRRRNLSMNLSDTGAPVLIRDLSDPDSIYVVMPMKI